MAKLLIVDDEPSILEFFKILLEREGYEVNIANGGAAGIQSINDHFYDIVITDLCMPEPDGMAVLDHARKMAPDTLVIMITAFATTESAVEAMKKGAYDYLMKPFKVDEIKLIICNALEKTALRQENEQLKREVDRQKGFSHFVGASEEMKHVFDLIERVAPGRSSILIAGESGTGKELAAKAIHQQSPRADKPFVSINCAAIPENLIESELFGYMRGAFTGAASNKMGLFEVAHHGTFFLDEVGELPPQVQVKLLRVLQEKSVRRLGGTASTPVDVRIISATNQDLEQAVKRGTFREDLYYRLNVIQVRMPALRDHREDIPALAQHFLKRFCEEQKKTLEGFVPEAMHKLVSYDYQGNVRELENVIEQCVALESSSRIQAETLPEPLQKVVAVAEDDEAEFPDSGVDLEKELDTYERRLLLEALRRAGGVKKKAANLLQISFRSIRYRLLKHGVESESEEASDDNCQPDSYQREK